MYFLYKEVGHTHPVQVRTNVCSSLSPISAAKLGWDVGAAAVSTLSGFFPGACCVALCVVIACRHRVSPLSTCRRC
jgi:hypothetical protein